MEKKSPFETKLFVPNLRMGERLLLHFKAIWNKLGHCLQADGDDVPWGRLQQIRILTEQSPESGLPLSALPPGLDKSHLVNRNLFRTSLLQLGNRKDIPGLLSLSLDFIKGHSLLVVCTGAQQLPRVPGWRRRGPLSTISSARPHRLATNRQC